MKLLIIQKLNNTLQVSNRGLRLVAASVKSRHLLLQSANLATVGGTNRHATPLLHGRSSRAGRHHLLRGTGDARGPVAGQTGPTSDTQWYRRAATQSGPTEPKLRRQAGHESQARQCGQAAQQRGRRAQPVQGGARAHDPGARHVLVRILSEGRGG